MEDEPIMTFGDSGIEPKPTEPRKRGRPKGSTNSGATRGRRPAVEPIKDGIRSLIGGMGLVLSAFPVTQQDAVILATKSEPLVDALGDLAKQNKAVRDVLSKMMLGSAWGGVVFASAGIALPILANHRLLPGPMLALFATDDEGKTVVEYMTENPDMFSVVTEQTMTSEGPTVANA
jgi:hypothetical protein